MRFMEGSRFPLNLMLWIDRSHDGRGEVFTVEVFDGQSLYLGRGDRLYPADVLLDDAVVRAAEEVFDRHVGDAERSVEDAHRLFHYAGKGESCHSRSDESGSLQSDRKRPLCGNER